MGYGSLGPTWWCVAAITRMIDADADAGMDAIVGMLEDAGHLIFVARPDGGVEYQLTQEGAQVARQLAMSSESEQDALLAGLLDTAGLT